MLNVYSEIGKLERVLLHRPGRELENLTPSTLHRLLFDDIPFLDVAQKEHMAFVEALQASGVEVFYITDLAAEALEANPEVVPTFIKRFLDEADVKSKRLRTSIERYLQGLSNQRMVETMIEGIRTHDVPAYDQHTIVDYLESEYPFHTDPMPNMLFQRDPFATIGRGASLHRMKTAIRNRETLFAEYALRYHPTFKKTKFPQYYSKHEDESLEGGDILVLDERTVAIGISARTDPYAVEKLTANLFNNHESFETLLAINIPKTRAFMHLDTVLTQVDAGLFVAHPEILDALSIFELRASGKDVSVKRMEVPLQAALSKHLQRDVEIIPCGGWDVVSSEREQWSDGANTLAVAPGRVITYSRNHVTNQLLREKGVDVIEIPSSELSRGRGGPRCMSMPLSRKPLNTEEDKT